MVKKIPKEPREIDSFGDNLPRTRSTCEQFEHFVAFIRSLKSIAYCGTQVALSEFHTGARFGSVDGIDIIEPHSRTVVENLRKVEAKPDTYFTNRRGYVDISKMKTIHINERKGFAGDIVTRVELIEKGSYRCDEVIQCKLFSTTRKVDKETYLKEREDAVSTDSDVFLFITSAEVADFDLPPRCGVISIEEFEQYFGSLTSRAYRSLLERLDIDNASHAKLFQVDGVGVVTPQEIIDKKQRVKAKKERKQAAEDVEATVTQEDQSNADEAEEAKRPMKKQKQEPKSKKNKKQGGKGKKPNGKN
ncbi:Crinkler (CRN) [Phytophthora megakarya]|uniref:Crinkler (CRN) n=1 Tax=Phytophthora megakarya TaxID=4795 RepID=A0A225UIK8_9STRA|nr:Crinkler (CRN) [Phytophthora megakarya]